MTASRRILLLITDLQVGGTPTVVRELAVRLREPGRVDVEVACLAPWGPVADQLREAGVTVTALDARSAVMLPIVRRRLVRLIRERRFDTVFSFLIHANTMAALAVPACPGVRFLQSVQTTQPRPAWHWWLQGRIHGRAERVVVPSPSVVQAASWRSRIPAEKFTVIPNAVDPADFADVNPPADGTPFPIGFLGRLDRVKRVPDLVDAVGRLGGLVQLHVFGGGPERAVIERRIAARGLKRWVTLHGPYARPQDALGRIGLLVLPSEAEGFGLVLIEAMAAGVPVVATDVPGIRDVVIDGTTGILVSPGIPQWLASAIRAMVEKPWLRARMAARARAEVERRFAWPAVLAQYRQLLGLS
ncbi:MAG: hypothetical protein AVDCRST_MAG64-4072 [uncultured Phycisphaerae bacterium]|uniref:Glycosyltransferase n=1 Tax=uncultured Phycisphaerae bacterium TaxID=904963 RepID=A0A6J4QHI0_9BACT|nr:MAG: hypothetical protein AVDCRST_MAG64-4072 [uncultured Phycisphaerae bacterium]